MRTHLHLLTSEVAYRIFPGPHIVKHPLIFFAWFLHLFNPPPLNSMNWLQKVGRIFLVSVTLLVTSILLAMLVSLAVFLAEQGSLIILSVPHLFNGILIIAVAIGVNLLCIRVLLAVIKADRKLIPQPGTDRK